MRPGAHLLLQPGAVLQLLLQLLLQELTLRAGLLLLSRAVALLAVQARQRDAPGVAVVPEVQLLLCCTQSESVAVRLASVWEPLSKPLLSSHLFHGSTKKL